jgi:two-component system, NarL family, response regulator DevR
MTKKTKIILVDDHEVVRLGLRTLLSNFPHLDIVGECENGDECLSLVRSKEPDIVLLDIRLPGKSGIEICKEIKEFAPSTRVVILTSFISKELLKEAVKSGANGYILKEIRTDYLIKMLDAVMRGETVFDGSTLSNVVERFQNGKKESELIAKLTSVEKHILQLMSAGKSNRDIAHTVHLSEKTIRNYVSSILDKLELHNRTEAAAFAIHNHINESS